MKIVIGLFVLLLLIIIGARFSMDYFKNNPSPFLAKEKTSTVKVGDQTFTVYLPKTDKEKQVGLSSRTSLAQDYGMLFQFGTPGYYPFWMRDMKFPIDMIFIRDNHVVAVFPNLKPPSDEENLTIYKPDEPADALLEINAGLAQKYNIKKGDAVSVKQ